ncbi:hypothetical protein HYH03_007485 [Edaphochlamys debaryana]|uniref:Uncharacterized protein n=1 Tax=Edaphochlamys debaryana TaxID=47281 RepID=A0A835Y1Y1_9CHLO|nr:hypothetical protein HYH03_007485 [Edaphochlamys debaryana]|eukprot:KAG2494433.1 hypothetical protein HYH03_007485 [Edaphochlamys debaryana]
MLRSLVACVDSEAGPPRLQTRFTIAKWFYCIGFAASAIAVWALRDYGGQFLADNVSSFDVCRQAADGAATAQCAGKEVALRVSMANLIFFGAHLLSCLLLTKAGDPRVNLHAGLWVWQVLAWVGSLIGFMWIPSSALVGYGQFARYASGIFLVLQLLLLVNFAYVVNEWLVAKDTRWAWALLVGGSTFAFAAGLVLTGVSYHYYAPAASCSLNIFFVTWNLVLGLALVGALFVPGRAPSAGLLTSSAVWLYCSYLVYSALASEPPNRCIRGGGVSPSGWVVVVAFFISLASVIYATLDAGTSSSDMFGSDTELPYRPDFFHVIFASASTYIAMLFTSWAVSSSGSSFQLDVGWASTWVKIASSWACALLYGWSVVAPAVLKNREFGPPV